MQFFCIIWYIDLLSWYRTTAETVHYGPSYENYFRRIKFRRQFNRKVAFLYVHCKPIPVMKTGFPVMKKQVFPCEKKFNGKPCFHYRDGFAVKIWLSKLLLWRKSNNSLDYKLCNQKKVNQPNKKKNINAVQDIRNICVHK